MEVRSLAFGGNATFQEKSVSSTGWFVRLNDVKLHLNHCGTLVESTVYPYLSVPNRGYNSF